MTREEFRDYVDFLRSQDEISYDVYSALIDGIDTLEQEPYDDAKYHEEHGEVIVDKAVWEDAKRALEQEPKTVKSCDTCKHDEAFGCPSFIHDRCENYSEWEQAESEDKE